MKISFKKCVQKQIESLPKSEQKKVFKKISLLAFDPYSGKSLKGILLGKRSIRAWPYRIIYTIKSDEIISSSVSHRQSVHT